MAQILANGWNKEWNPNNSDLLLLDLYHHIYDVINITVCHT
jgi:hypothetical protein